MNVGNFPTNFLCKTKGKNTEYSKSDNCHLIFYFLLYFCNLKSI